MVGAELSDTPAEPEPLSPEPAVPEESQRFRPHLVEAGAEPVEEHGLLHGEVRGLEVARVVQADGVGGWRLEIGVGKHDREAHLEVLDREPRVDDLFRVVRQVLEFRAPGSEGHAAYQLAPERWLRWVLMQRPDLVDAEALEPVPSPVARHDLRHLAPAPARSDGILFVCSVGVDLDFVPAAADGRHAQGDEPELVLVVPEGDDHRVTRELVEDLDVPARIATVTREWRSLQPRSAGQ